VSFSARNILLCIGMRRH